MTRPSCRYLALAVLAFIVSALAPPSMPAAGIHSPAPAARAIAPRATQGSATVDTVAGAVALDSAVLRRAIDSAKKHAIDSVLTQVSEDRRQWGRVINGLLVLGGVFLVLLVWDMVRGHDVMIESHWGGFGGGAGGTRLSRALVLTVLLLLTGGMLTVLAVARPGRVRVVQSAARTDTSGPKVDSSRAVKQSTTTQTAPSQSPATSTAGRTSGS